MKRGARCVHCSSPIPHGANYCHHCGRRTRGLHEALKLCPHCKKQVDVLSTYCKHCGTTLTGKKQPSPLSFLLHIVVFLVILLGLFLLYTYPRPLQEQQEELPLSATVSLSELTCAPTTKGFDVCGKVSWEGGAYAKAYIPGGEELDISKKQSGPFTYCQSVGSEEGLRVFRAFVYDSQEHVVADRGEGVSCVKKAPVIITPPSTYLFTKKVQFFTENQFQRPEGRGNVPVSFPDPVLSCTLEGTWKTDNMVLGSLGRPQLYCHDARGTFTGQLAFTKQSVTTDAGPFLWDSMTLIDPLPTTYEGYIAYMRTCDTQYLAKERYFTSVQARGMGTDTLVLDWYYKNDDTQPRVDFSLDFICQLRRN